MIFINIYFSQGRGKNKYKGGSKIYRPTPGAAGWGAKSFWEKKNDGANTFSEEKNDGAETFLGKKNDGARTFFTEKE